MTVQDLCMKLQNLAHDGFAQLEVGLRNGDNITDVYIDGDTVIVCHSPDTEEK